MTNRIYLVGFMGSGKSWYAPQISETLNIPFIDTDSEIENKSGMTVSSIFETYGESYFRKLESEVIRELSCRYSDVVIATGGGLPCHNNNMNYMNENGLTIFINPPIEVLVSRLSNDSYRPLINGKSSQDLRIFIEEKLKNRLPFYSLAQWEVFPAILE